MKKIKNLNFLMVICMMVAGSFMLLSMSNLTLKPWPVPDKYKAMKNTKAGDKDAGKIGKSLWDQHCKSCHGAKGAGDGTKASKLSTPMRDLGSAEVQSQKDGELYYKSYVGRDEMPNFEKKITAEGDRWLLINYMRSMKK